MGQLQQIDKYLVKERPTTFAQCIEWARLQYELDYVNEIKQLLFNLPKDQVCSLSFDTCGQHNSAMKGRPSAKMFPYPAEGAQLIVTGQLERSAVLVRTQARP